MAKPLPLDPHLNSESTAPTQQRAYPGMFFIIAGPAGAGKNSLMRHVIESGTARQLPTVTTRPMRPGEKEGRDHLFVNHDEFQRMIKVGELLEWQKVHDNLYGMHRPTLEAALEAGEAIISDIDINGAQAAREAIPNNVSVIFLQTPTISDLIDRMRIRGESTASVGLRLLRVGKEIDYAKSCDAIITNDNVERASEKLLAIVRSVLADGNANAFCDELITYRYQIGAQAILVCEGEALSKNRGVEYPFAVCAPDEQPANAARRILTETFPDIVIPGHHDASMYRPPAVIDYRESAEGVEIVIYSYVVPIQEKFAPPEGWRWISITP